ncbi:hypothetical protein B0H10DRAFT_2435125 [Mycena sp. CBHHK59/15]|nr:hypothetical protein B0H10DRAFT_2435125 [Mycena sp. CBHHK59/15]
MALPSFWPYFHKGEMKNMTQHYTYCKACVKHYQEDNVVSSGSAAGVQVAHGQTFQAGEKIRKPVIMVLTLLVLRMTACEAAGSIRGEKTVWIAHLIGGKGIDACQYASEEAKAAARAHRAMLGEKAAAKKGPLEATPEGPPKKKQQQTTLTTYTRTEMPFGKTETDAIQKQALRAVISANIAFRSLRNPEMLKLFGMLRSAGDNVPTSFNPMAEEEDGEDVGDSQIPELESGESSMQSDEVNETAESMLPSVQFTPQPAPQPAQLAAPQFIRPVVVQQTLLPGASTPTPGPATQKAKVTRRCALCVEAVCPKRHNCRGSGGKKWCICGHPPLKKNRAREREERTLQRENAAQTRGS